MRRKTNKISNGVRLSLLIAGFLLVGLFGVAAAQNEILPAKESLPALPDPGQKPGDFFYFLDQWTEGLQEFFTFNPEAKALLQTERALERIAEIKALLETKGVDAPGLAVAQEKIQANMARASQILKQQKAKGKEIAQLAQKLDDDFDARQELLKQTFEVEKAKLKVQKEEIKLQILQARQAGDFDKVAQLRATLVGIEAQKEAIEKKWEAQENDLESEEENLEAELGDEEKESEELEEQEEDLLDQKEKEIERAFKQREKALELQEKSLEIDLKKALLEGDEAIAQQIRAQLLDLEAQKEALEQEEEAAEEALKKEERKLEKARDLRERAEGQIEEAKEEIADVVEKVKEMTEEIPAVSELLSEAQNKLTAAEEAFEAEKYGEAYGQAMAAEMLARNAERKIEQEEEKLEELEEKLEKKEEAEGREGKIELEPEEEKSESENEEVGDKAQVRTPVSYRINSVPYYREDNFCYGAAAMMMVKYSGLTEQEVQLYRSSVKSGLGGPPDIFKGFKESDLIDEVRIGYSKNYNQGYAGFYNSQLLVRPREQTVLFDNKDEALTYLKKLVSSNVLVMVIAHSGNHYLIVTGYDENYIYINDPGFDDGYNYSEGSYQEKTKMTINHFLEQWTISGFEGGGIGFPGDYGMIWLVK